MARELLAAVIEQAERAEPPVRAAAFLHVARVLTRYDLAAAEALLDRGIALARELPEIERTPILTNAIFLSRCRCAVTGATALCGLPPAGSLRKRRGRTGERDG